jgi:hypothetical protein
MKNKFFLLIFILLNIVFVRAQNNIWGVWNLGEKADAVMKTRTSLGVFIKTGYYLIFDEKRENWDGKPCLLYEGGGYEIKNIFIKDDIISLVIECESRVLNEKNRWVEEIITGKALVHFLDEDHIWLELDYSDKNYFTHPQFPTGDFKGRDVIYWRAEKIET